uniref:STARD3 N-terminal-like protein isoform X3 n=1 Tax=Doryrhamphus excisus TaxID=161450 RepID=UPI0025AE56C9|nr:STARD3 N-terminal-like protein isoform X3 [Doryrhamphus excisus]
MDSRCSSSADSRTVARVAINSTPVSAHGESYEVAGKKCISDVRRTFCLFVTFDLLFITLLWIIELNVNGGIPKQLDEEVLHYDYHASFFDIFVWLLLLKKHHHTHAHTHKHTYTHTHWRALTSCSCCISSPTLASWQLLAVFRFASLILAYAVFRLRHWWAIAVTTAVSCAFLIAKVILSKVPLSFIQAAISGGFWVPAAHHLLRVGLDRNMATGL